MKKKRLIKKAFAFLVFIFIIPFAFAEKAHIVLSNEQNFVFMENDGTGKFTAKETIDVSSWAHEITAGDFDLDGIMDAAVNHHNEGAFTVLWRNQDKTFTKEKFVIPIAPNGEMHAIGSGDFDEDGDVDLALVDNGFSQSVVIALSDGKRGFSGFKKFEAAGNLRVIKVSDFNNDKHLDFIVPNSGGNNAFIFFGDGTGNFNMKSFGGGANLHNVEIGDVDNDGDVDIAVASGQYIRVLKNDGTGNFIAPTNEVEGLFCIKDSQKTCVLPDFYSVEISDIDNDRDKLMDIIGLKSDGIYIWRGTGNGYFKASARKPVSVELTQVFRNAIDIEAANLDDSNINELIIGYLDSSFGASLGNTGILVFKNKIVQYCSETDIKNCCPNEKGCCQEDPNNPPNKIFLGRGPICVDTLNYYSAGKTNEPDQVMIDVYYEKEGVKFIRGDIDNSGILDITDAITLLGYLFQAGKEPTCLDAADVDDSGILDLTDAIYLLQRLFQGGAEIPEPRTFGIDITQDSLDCKCYRAGC